VTAAALTARLTEVPTSVAVWVGAVVASGLPDLDLLSELMGRKGPRYHRNASHSLLILTLVSMAIMLAVGWAGADRRMAIIWIVALFSHPFLDLVTTGPDVADLGYGIALWWPFSKRRYHVPRPIIASPNLEGCRSVADVWREVRVEVLTLVPMTVGVILALSIW
jgi:membrane-bound metal-dependent hydrolase YbcI (DUF457 family)